jgi:hypothetical protein
VSLTNLISELNLEKTEKIITPIIDKFLSEEKNIVITDKAIQEKLIEIVSDNSNSKRTGRFGASSRGSCLRKQMFDYTGDIQKLDMVDTTLQNLFNDGTWRHIRWQMMGLMSGALTDVEAKVSSEKYPSFGGSIDGIGFSKEYGKYGFELKGTSYMTDSVKDIHLKQIHTYFVLDPEIKLFSVIYEDKRTQDWREFLVYPDPKILTEVKAEMQSLEDGVTFFTYPDVKEQCRLRQGKEYQMCPYRNECLEFNNGN